MKIILILFFLFAATAVYFLSQPKDDVMKETKAFIKKTEDIRRADSISSDRQMQIRIAEIKAKQ